MELNDASVQSLVSYLQQTLSPDAGQRKAAEKFLTSVEKQKNYPLVLLTAVAKETVDINHRITAAVTFKNYVKRNWRVTEDSGDMVHASDRELIRSQIVDLMLSSPLKIQNQLSDSISIIGREDFPGKWPSLLSQLIEKMTVQDFHVINGVLRTAHSLFRRYRNEMKSQTLWTEIKLVLDNFSKPLTDLFVSTMALAEQHAANAEALKVIYSSLNIISKIFYSLNSQDLPEFFEDNMAIWMTHFSTLLSANIDLLEDATSEEASVVVQVKSQICDNIALYAQRYDEEFKDYLPAFITAVWGLLTGTGHQVKYDLLVSNAILFLASAADRPCNACHFEDPDRLNSICEKVVVPNMQFREADEELFEDSPEEYIRKDVEGSDTGTRRRAACDLVKALSRQFEGQVIRNFSAYVGDLLSQYQANPTQKWKAKDTALYLVTTLAVKGSTQKHGTTQASELVNLIEFYGTHILPDLQSPDVSAMPVLKADSIKYLMTFRNQLSSNVLQEAVPHLLRFLGSPNYVIHSYAAMAIEKLITVKDSEGKPVLTQQSMASVEGTLLTHLFGALEHEGSAENEYVMKAVMRSLSLIQSRVIPFLDRLFPSLTAKLLMVARNPRKPHFNHFLFESLCVVIRSSCEEQPALVASFETGLFPPIYEILEKEVQEFLPYVFQILSLMLELQPAGKSPDSYMALFPLLLTPALWECQGNVPALTRLLQAYLERAATLIPEDKISGLLGVFQKLNASKVNDHHGLYLLGSIIEHMPMSVLSPYIQRIFGLLFGRLTSSKTTKFVKGLLVFFCLYAGRIGASELIAQVDAVQAKLFSMVVKRLFIPDLRKVAGSSERKICAVGITRLLSEAPVMLQGYAELWGPLLQTLIEFFELPVDGDLPDDEHYIDVEDTAGYQTAYSQLAFAGKKNSDPFKGSVGNPKMFLAQSVYKLYNGNPQLISQNIQQNLNADAKKFLQAYVTEAKLPLIFN